MTSPNLSYMFQALNRLQDAVDTAAASIAQNKTTDDNVLKRVSMYKEIIRRQHTLISQLEKASDKGDWQEVSRITSLVHGASLLIKVDADFLLSALKGAKGFAFEGHN